MHWDAMMRIGAQTPAAPRTAVVTGATSGIGAVYARWLARFGYDLILVGRREERLNAVANDLSVVYGVQAEVLTADLSTEAGIQKVETYLLEHGGIDFLVNNAGYGVMGKFADVPIDQQIGVINCHVVACTRFCRAVLPGMIARNRGAIVNVASVAAFMPGPDNISYNATKSYLNVLTEGMALELRDTQVRVQSLCPGFTITEFHDRPQLAPYQIRKRIPAWMWMKPEQVVKSSYRALVQRQVVYVPGPLNQVITAISRVGITALAFRTGKAAIRSLANRK